MCPYTIGRFVVDLLALVGFGVLVTALVVGALWLSGRYDRG